MGKIVYLDTNIFNHLINKEYGITDEEKDSLRSKVIEGKISIPLSFINFEEIFCTLESYPDLAKKYFLIMSELSNNEKLIKTPETLISDDINSFINYGVGSIAFYPASLVKINTKELLNNKKSEEFLGIIRGIKEEKVNFRLENINIRNEILANVEIVDHVPSYEQLYESEKNSFIRGLIEEIGIIERFRYININRLLQIRSVQLCVGWSISYIYGQLFENRKPERGDSRDMKHAVSASAADFFVTHDRNLSTLMKRIPIQNFEVCNIHELLEKI
jgi:hypothetical protein